MTNVADTDAPTISELPDDIRVPLHSLQADMGYLFGRALEDPTCTGAMVESIQHRLSQIEKAVLSAASLPLRDDAQPNIGGERAVLMDAARDWINSAPHAEECFTNDPNPDACRCICGKDSILAKLDDDELSALSPSSPKQGVTDIECRLALEVIERLIRENIHDNGTETDRMMVNGEWHTGPVVDASFRILRGLQQIAANALIASSLVAKGGK